MKRINNILFLFILNVFISSIIFSKVTFGEELYIAAKAAIAVDCNSKVVMYEKNSDQLLPIASTTKIMTIMTALKYGDLDKKVEISNRAATVKGSTVGYKKGEIITIKELMYGLMLRSGNDAAIALSEGVSGSVESFVKLMNEYALDLGLNNSHFVLPHGLDEEGHYSTVYDLALITIKAKENSLFNTIVKTKDAEEKQFGFSRSYHNINKILYLLPESDGVKTGYTGEAGKCLVTSVKLQGKSVVIIVLNCNERWKETEKIYNYLNTNYTYKKFFSKARVLTKVAVEQGENPVNISSNKDIEIPIKNNSNYEVKLIKPEKVYAPVKAKDKIGSVKILKDGNLIYSSSLNSLNDSNKKHKRFWIFNKE